MKDNKFNLKDEYNKIKFKLPKFEDVDKEFELTQLHLKDKAFLIRTLRRRVNEKVIFYCRVIENVIYPNPSNFISMQELKAFTEDEKKKMNDLHKKLMLYERESLILDVNPDEKKDAEYINGLWKNWSAFKKELINVTLKMKDSWKHESKSVKDNYFG